ncbi:hypothetical protein D3C75_896790 [compost metagenome]
MLVSVEKYVDHYALRVRSGLLTGDLVSKFETEQQAKEWAYAQGAEVITTVTLYKGLEIAKDVCGKFYIFNLQGAQCLTNVVFRSESHCRDLIDWNLDCKAKGFV